MPIQIDATKKGAIADFIREKTEEGATIYIPSKIFTIFALNELKDVLLKTNRVKFLFTEPAFIKKVTADAKKVKEFTLAMNGREKNVSEFGLEITLKNSLNQNNVANQCYLILNEKFDVKSVTEDHFFNNNCVLIDNVTGDSYVINSTNFEFSMPGLGYINEAKFNFSVALDDKDSVSGYKKMFDEAWDDKSFTEDVKSELLKHISNIYKENSPELVYYVTLYNLFSEKLLHEDDYASIKESTGITHSKIWSMLYNFQQDAVVGAVHKIQKYDGCIIADSVGLGKTFEALAVIKYYELRNERVLVLCPKKLRNNWTGFKQNTVTNPLVDDKFRYDVLNHTDLSRLKGMSGDIDLTKINWGNYDLVVIDESHAFRNKPSSNDRVTRYSRLMESIIKSGVKTKVLLLSATPVNNRLSDLKNQISIITADTDDALEKKGKNIVSIDSTLRIAQGAFNAWAKKDAKEKTTDELLNSLSMDFFDLLDTYTIARSRKHIQKYYDTEAIGKFPERLKPISVNVGADLTGKFPKISEMNEQILMLHLAIYSPLMYVLPKKADEYKEKYKTLVKDGKSVFNQLDREKNLVNLMRINILKRLESGVNSFGLTVTRILEQVNKYLDMIDNSGTDEAYEPGWDDDDDDELTPVIDEEMEIGGKIKVKLADMDLIKFKQDLTEDREKLAYLKEEADLINPETDAKLEELKHQIALKIKNPINEGNKKVIVFSAFSDTAKYLYDNIAGWALNKFGIYSGIVTGSSVVASNLKCVNNSFDSVLAYFSPVSNHFKTDKEIDILFATDCISEGQNLQDCDYLINYDIHWNPVRIIQRFGRIDRIGSKNDKIQLVNFWPSMDLDEYIKLENRVKSRMVMVDVTATGEDDLLNVGSKDLEYRADQLKQLQNEVVDLDDLKGGISLTDFTLSDYVLALSKFNKEHPAMLEKYPTGIYAVTDIPEAMKDSCCPGVIFCLKQTKYTEKEKNSSSIHPYYLVYIKDNGEILVKYSNPKIVLDLYKGLCANNKEVLPALVEIFNKETDRATDMSKYTKLLEKVVNDIKGIVEKKGVESLFGFGQSSLLTDKVSGVNDFELITFLVVK